MEASVIAGALAKAGVDKLPPAARAYLANRLVTQGTDGHLSAENLGGLRAYTFGARKLNVGGTAKFPSAEAAARALVATSYRAAPRDWASTSKGDLARLGNYPMVRDGAKALTSARMIPIPTSEGALELASPDVAQSFGAVLGDAGAWDLTKVSLGGLPVGEFKWSYLIPGYGPYKLVKDYLGPSEEAEKTFQGLIADWEAFDRLGVGGDILPELRQDSVDWRKFREDWQNGDIPSKDIGGRLTAEVVRANRVRLNLAEQKITDPALGTGLRAGVEVASSVPALVRAEKVDAWARSIPVVNWITAPDQKTVSPLGFPMPERALWTIGAGLVGALGIFAAIRR